MPATANAQTTWRPRINPSNISSANASMPPHPPQGYQGPWPPPPPPGYPGPPPAQLPASVSAHQWSKGYWRFDPKATGWSSASGAPPQPQPQQQYYNPGVVNNNVPRPASQQAGGPPGWSQAWVPHPGWQMPADHNPYKRMPKEPDPSYFSFELSENPLGLENMHITYALDYSSHVFIILIMRSPPTNLVFSLGFIDGHHCHKRNRSPHHGGGCQKTCLPVTRTREMNPRLRTVSEVLPPVMTQTQWVTTTFPPLRSGSRPTIQKHSNPPIHER